MADQVVSIKLRLDGQSGVVKGVEDVSGGFARMRRSARDAVADVAHLGGALLVFNSLAGPVRDAARAVDAFGAAASRIDLVTRSAQQSAAVQAQLFAVAQASRVQYTELAEVYARLARAAGNLGVSQARMLAVTQSISQAMTIGGGSADSMRAALVQLGQGLASGTLRGEELNSILEQTPRLAQAIAEGMGVGVGELRKLGEQGRITSQQIVGALEKEAPKLAQEFARIAPTLSSAFTVLKDGAARAFVEFDRGAGASRALAEAMMSLGKSLGEAGAAARDFGERYGALLKTVGEVGGFLLAAAAAEKLAGFVGRLAAYAKSPIVIGVTLAVAGYEAAKAVAENPGFLGWQLKGAEKDLAEISALQARGMRAGEEALFDGLERRIAQARARVDTIKRDLSVATEKARQDSPEYKAEQARFANAGGFRAQEIADLNDAAGGGVPFPGAKPLNEVREYVKTSLSIQEEWNTKAVALAQAYANAIATAEGPQAADLARSRDAELTALAEKARKEMAALAGGKEIEALAKARLDGQLALEKAGSEARLEALKAAHAAGLIDEEAYTRDVLAETRSRLAAEYALLEKQYAAAPDAAAREQALTRMRETAIALARAQGQAEADLAAIARRRAAESLEWSRQGAQAAAKEYDDLLKQRDARRREGAEIGLTREQLDALNLARLDEAVRLKETAIEQAAAEVGREAEVALMREQLGLMRDIRAQTASNQTRALAERQATDIANEYARAFESIQSALTDAIFDGGESGLKGIEDLVKRYTKAFAAEFVIRPIIQPIYAQAAGLFGIDMSKAGGSWANMGGGGLGGMSNIFSPISNIATSSIGGSAFGAGMLSGVSESLLGASFVGPSASLAGNASIAAGASFGSFLPAIGIGLGLLSLFGGDLFGGKEKPPVAAWTQFPQGSKDWGIPLATPWGDLRFAGQHMGDTEAEVAKLRDSFAPIAQRDFAISSLLSSDENKRIEQAIAGYTTGEMEDYSEAAMRAHFEKRLDLVSDAIGGWVDEIADAFSGSLEDSYAAIATLLSVRGVEGAEELARAFIGTFESAAGEAIVQARSGTFMDGFINNLNAGSGGDTVVSALSRDGESLADTFVRLVSDLVAVRDAFDLMGRAALDFSLDAAVLATDIAEAFGGREAFGQQFAAYYEQFYSEAERLAAHTKNTAEAFGDLGLAMPDTHAAFRAIIDGLDLTTAAGQELFAGLLKLVPAFDIVADAAAAQAATMRGLSIEWAEAYGRPDWAKEMRRQDVRASITDQDQLDLQNAVWRRQDMAAKRELEIQLMEAQGNDAGATAARRALELEGTDEALRALKQQIWAAQDARVAAEEQARLQEQAAAAARQAAEEQARAQQALRDGWQRVAESVLDTMRRLRGEILGEERGYAAAQAEFALANAAARAGDQSAFARLPELARAISDLAGSVAETSAEEEFIKASALGALRTTLGMAGARFGLAVPAFATGADVVPFDMVAKIHKGERIVPAADNAALMARLGDVDLAAELRELRRENAELRRMIDQRLAAIERHTDSTAAGVHGRNASPILVEVAQ